MMPAPRTALGGLFFLAARLSFRLCESTSGVKNADFTRGPNSRRCCGCGFLNRTSIKELGLYAASFPEGWYLRRRISIGQIFCFVLGLGRLQPEGLVKRL